MLRHSSWPGCDDFLGQMKDSATVKLYCCDLILRSQAQPPCFGRIHEDVIDHA
jgi:hypothetical protein